MTSGSHWDHRLSHSRARLRVLRCSTSISRRSSHSRAHPIDTPTKRSTCLSPVSPWTQSYHGFRSRPILAILSISRVDPFLPRRIPIFGHSERVVRRALYHRGTSSYSGYRTKCDISHFYRSVRLTPETSVLGLVNSERQPRLDNLTKGYLIYSQLQLDTFSSSPKQLAARTTSAGPRPLPFLPKWPETDSLEML